MTTIFNSSFATDVTADVRTYMAFTYPVDIRAVQTVPDLEMSYALASTLVTLSPDEQVVSLVADKWEVSGKIVKFTISAAAKWSDGSKITSQDVINSFYCTKKDFANSLPSLYSSVLNVSAPATNIVQFDLSETTGIDEFLKKLSEPMYGIVSVLSGNYSLAKSSGPFTLNRSDKHEVDLRVNRFWVKYLASMAKVVQIRVPKKSIDEETLNSDQWPNLVTVSSLVSSENSKNLKVSFNSWHRNDDRFFLLRMAGALPIKTGRQLLEYLSVKVDRHALMKGLAGYQLADQFYARGTGIYDSEFVPAAGNLAVQMPPVFATRPLRFLYSSSRVTPALLENFKKVLVPIFPHGVEFHETSLSELGEKIKSEKFDLYAGSYGADTINLDGAMSYYIESPQPVIPSDEGGGNNFSAMLKSVRTKAEVDRAKEFVKILERAITSYTVVPLFHYSTMAFTRKNLDLSAVPTTDEAVSFSKIIVIHEDNK